MIFILTFVCGALYEITSANWLFSTERLKPVKASLWSMIQALVMLTGIGESIKDVRVAACFVCGYSIGSGLAVAIEKHFRARAQRTGAGTVSELDPVRR
jgi:hypothetical protein